MEFWGAEIKAGEPFKVEVQDGWILHLSQASIGESKKGKASESAVLYATVDFKKHVLGTLSHDNFPQISYDLVFEKDFELSHNWKNGSVHFCGYMQEQEGLEDDEMFGSEFDSEVDSEEEEVPLAIAENGKPKTKDDKPKVSSEKAKASKPDSATKNLKGAKPIIDEDDDSDDEEDDSDDEDMVEAGDESDDDDDDEESSDEEDEPTPKNDKQAKKRAAESATKTPAPEKKAKLVTPTKSGGDKKKGNAHTATPHPAKQGGKTNASADKPKQQTPKSAGQVACKSCSKTFNSDGAMESHTKAKHSGGK